MHAAIPCGCGFVIRIWLCCLGFYCPAGVTDSQVSYVELVHIAALVSEYRIPTTAGNDLCGLSGDVPMPCNIVCLSQCLHNEHRFNAQALPRRTLQ